MNRWVPDQIVGGLVADDTDFGAANIEDNDPALEHTFALTGLKLPTGFTLVEGLRHVLRTDHFSQQAIRTRRRSVFR
jgi:hypothetical protein